MENAFYRSSSVSILVFDEIRQCIDHLFEKPIGITQYCIKGTGEETHRRVDG